MEDRLEQSVTINAGLDRVWDLVSQPGWWVPSTLESAVDRTVGHRTVRESARWGRFVVEVVSVDPPGYAAFRWASEFPGDDPVPGKATLVEFFVKEVGEAVEVTVVESGFAALQLPAERRASARKDNTNGWQEELAELTARAERAPAG